MGSREKEEVTILVYFVLSAFLFTLVLAAVAYFWGIGLASPSAQVEQPGNKQDLPKSQPKQDAGKVKSKPGFFSSIPTGIDPRHAKIIRDYLAENLATGEWEEIEWIASPFEAGHLTNLNEMFGQMTRDADDRLSGRPIETSERDKNILPAGIKTTLKLRAVNDDGNRKVVTVGVIERGTEWQFMNLQNEHYVSFDPAVCPE